ncbi:MAG: hypothetical protein IKO51_02925 [Clostridia bacterium]|nr:hypothetical protein [Clostridia bacterium]
MNNILPILYMLAFAACGVLIARPVFKNDDPLRRVFFGLVFGLVLLIWLPALFAFLCDFTLAAQLLALGAAVLLAFAATLVSIRKIKKEDYRAFGRGELKKKLLPLLLTVIPILAICFILHISHTIRTASDGSLHVGQCTYGDLCMHLGFISSISVQKTFPPDYSLLPGTKLGYPFLCDSVSSTFMTLGADLRWAAILPALYACTVVAFGVYFFFDTWFKNTKTTVLATYLFFIGGGFGFWYFFNNSKLLEAEGVDRMQELMTGFYKMPTNMPSEGLRWVNAIADMLLPQRATLFGWAILFPALQLLFRGAVENEDRAFIPLGVLAGSLPLIHTHSFLALGIISAVLFIGKLLALLKTRNPSRRTELAVRLIGCFIVMLILAVLKRLPIRVEGRDADVLTVTGGCLIAGLTAMIIALVSLIAVSRRIRKNPHEGGDIGALGLLVLAVAVSVVTVLSVRKGGALSLIAPLVGIVICLLTALFPDDFRRENGEEIRYQVREATKNLGFFALFGVITLALAAPQLFGFTLKQSGASNSFLRWGFNWDNVSDGWLWFYIKNLGLIFILMPAAFLHLKKEHRVFFGGALAIWAISEIFLFQPNPYDNNKLLFVWFAMSCGIAASLLIDTLAVKAVKTENGEEVTDGARTAGRLILLAIAIVSLTLSGVMTLAREYVSADHLAVAKAEDGKIQIGVKESGYEVVPAHYMEVVDWVKENTEPDAVFLTCNNHNNPIAMLTGRNIFVGSGVFLHWHGVNYRPREALLRGLFEAPGENLYPCAEQYGVDYVLVSPFERSAYSVDIRWFEENLECVFRGSVSNIYKVAHEGGGE